VQVQSRSNAAVRFADDGDVDGREASAAGHRTAVEERRRFGSHLEGGGHLLFHGEFTSELEVSESRDRNLRGADGGRIRSDSPVDVHHRILGEQRVALEGHEGETASKGKQQTDRAIAHIEAAPLEGAAGLQAVMGDRRCVLLVADFLAKSPTVSDTRNNNGRPEPPRPE
jgi:hypothetical protein